MSNLPRIRRRPEPNLLTPAHKRLMAFLGFSPQCWPADRLMIVASDDGKPISEARLGRMIQDINKHSTLTLRCLGDAGWICENAPVFYSTTKGKIRR